MALGGVPMGNMLAQLAPNVMGIPSNNGSMPKAIAREETTGANTITWATLLINSLTNTDIRVIMNTSRKP